MELFLKNSMWGLCLDWEMTILGFILVFLVFPSGEGCSTTGNLVFFHHRNEHTTYKIFPNYICLSIITIRSWSRFVLLQKAGLHEHNGRGVSIHQCDDRLNQHEQSPNNQQSDGHPVSAEHEQRSGSEHKPVQQPDHQHRQHGHRQQQREEKEKSEGAAWLVSGQKLRGWEVYGKVCKWNHPNIFSHFQSVLRQVPEEAWGSAGRRTDGSRRWLVKVRLKTKRIEQIYIWMTRCQRSPLDSSPTDVGWPRWLGGSCAI